MVTIFWLRDFGYVILVFSWCVLVTLFWLRFCYVLVTEGRRVAAGSLEGWGYKIYLMNLYLSCCFQTKASLARNQDLLHKWLNSDPWSECLSTRNTSWGGERELFGLTFWVKKGLRTPKVRQERPKGLTPEIKSPFWNHFGTMCSHMFAIAPLKNTSKIDSFFLRFAGRPERFTGWAHMQSVHACAVQTHFSVFESSFEK